MNQNVEKALGKAGQEFRELREVLERLAQYYQQLGLSEERAFRSALADFSAEVSE
jgi:hypothetical protein